MIHGFFTPLIQLVATVSPVWIIQTIASYQQIQVRLVDAALFAIIELHEASMNKFSCGNTVNSHRKFPKNSLVFEGISTGNWGKIQWKIFILGWDSKN